MFFFGEAPPRRGRRLLPDDNFKEEPEKEESEEQLTYCVNSPIPKFPVAFLFHKFYSPLQQELQHVQLCTFLGSPNPAVVCACMNSLNCLRTIIVFLIFALERLSKFLCKFVSYKRENTVKKVLYKTSRVDHTPYWNSSLRDHIWNSKLFFISQRA